MPQRVQKDRCKYFEICGQPATWQEAGEDFCVLHVPEAQSIEALSKALNKYREAGGCDFRYMVFPREYGALSLENHVFEEVADFRNVKCAALALNGSRFKQDLIIDTGAMAHVSLEQTTIGGSLTLKAPAISNGIMLGGAQVEGVSTIEAGGSVELRLWNAHFAGPVRISSQNDLRAVWNQAAFGSGLTVRAIIRSNPESLGCDFSGFVDLQNCIFIDGCDLSLGKFRDSHLDLSGARFRGSLILGGQGAFTPSSIRIEGTVIDGDLQVKADFRARAPRLVAREERPRVSGSAEFANVDLSQCLLYGNAIQSMSFSRVVWTTHAGRYLLFDEIAEKAQHIPLDGLKETY